MAGKDTDEIVVAANGSVFVAPLGSPLPAKISAPLSAAWKDLGFTSETGVDLIDAKTLVSIPVWQLFYPARRIVTGRDMSLKFVLRQWAHDQMKLGFGGGAVVQDAVGEYSYEPPDPEFIDERMMAVEWSENENNYRWIVRRGLVTDNVETKLTRTAAMDLPITFGIIGEADQKPWKFQTDDPSFVPVGGS